MSHDAGRLGVVVVHEAQHSIGSLVAFAPAAVAHDILEDVLQELLGPAGVDLGWLWPMSVFVLNWRCEPRAALLGLVR